MRFSVLIAMLFSTAFVVASPVAEPKTLMARCTCTDNGLGGYIGPNCCANGTCGGGDADYC